MRIRAWVPVFRGNNPTNVLGTIHFGGLYPNNDQSHGPSFTFTGGDSVTNFHVYAARSTFRPARRPPTILPSPWSLTALPVAIQYFEPFIFAIPCHLRP